MTVSDRIRNPTTMENRPPTGQPVEGLPVLYMMLLGVARSDDDRPVLGLDAGGGYRAHLYVSKKATGFEPPIRVIGRVVLFLEVYRGNTRLYETSDVLFDDNDTLVEILRTDKGRGPLFLPRLAFAVPDDGDLTPLRLVLVAEECDGTRKRIREMELAVRLAESTEAVPAVPHDQPQVVEDLPVVAYDPDRTEKLGDCFVFVHFEGKPGEGYTLSCSGSMVDPLTYRIPSELSAGKERLVELSIPMAFALERELDLPADGAESKREFGEYLAELHYFSAGAAQPLINQLLRAKDAYAQTVTDAGGDPEQDVLHVVVIDKTELQIPWELLVITRTGEPDRYLGELFAVTRWFPPNTGDLKDDFPRTEVEKRGPVVAFLSPDFRPRPPAEDHERKCLEKYCRRIYGEQEGDLERFFGDLINNQPGYTDVALVYIVAHGYRETKPGTDISSDRKLRFGLCVRTHDQKITLSQLVAQFELLEKSGSVVFINACESTLGTIAYFAPDRPISLPTHFLDRGATAVIGTTAAVYNWFAAEFARQVVAKVEAGQSLHEALRELRRKEARELPHYSHLGSVSRDRAERFLFAFSYVYYGNPEVQLFLEEPS